MRAIGLPALVAGLAIVSSGLAPPSHAADATSAIFQGVWKISEAESHYPAFFPTIKNHIFTVEKDDGTILQYTDRWEISGKPFSQHYDGVWGGKTAKSSDGHTMWYKHVGPDGNKNGGYEDGWTDDAGTKGEDHCTFTTPIVMDCKGAMTPKGGQTASYTEHWNKVQ